MSHAYRYNSANQRTRATREDNAYWAYGYDGLGQVTSGVKHLPDTTTILGHDFGWTFDDIGNRRSASRNASSSEALAKEDYTTNLLNQYTQRTIPGKFDLLAAANPGTTVTYQYPADTGRPTPLPLYADLRYTQLTADNSTSNVNTTVKVTGVKNLAGPNGEDAIAEITRGVYLPQTPETFSHDADGNLTGDAKWAYAWDAENRLTRLTARPGTVRAGHGPRLVEFVYDAQGRRVEKRRTLPAPHGVVLKLKYYDLSLLEGGVVLESETGALDYNRVGGWHPTRAAPVRGYSVQWAGLLRVPTTGEWTLKLEESSGHGYRLWLDGVLRFAAWPVTASGGVQTVTLTLEAGRDYALQVDLSEPEGTSWWAPAVARLKWNGPGVVDEVIPGAWYVDPTPYDRIETAHYLYEGWSLLAEVDALDSNALVRSYAWGLDLSGSMQGAGGVGGLLFANLSGGTHAPAFDGNGNVIGYVDLATGAKSATYEYNAFGETIIADGPAADAMPFGFSTKYRDGETGKIDFGLRIYDPPTGRWLSKDPIEEAGHEALRAALSPEPEPTWQSVFEAATVSPEIVLDDVSPVFGGNAYLGMRNNALSYVDPNGENPLLAGALAVARKLLLELLKNRGKKIAECEAIYRGYEFFKDKCRSCKGCTVKAEAQKNAACYAAEVAGRALYLKKRCDYILPGSIGRGSKRAEDGHKTQLADKTAALAICTAKAASLPDPKP